LVVSNDAKSLDSQGTNMNSWLIFYESRLFIEHKNPETSLPLVLKFSEFSKLSRFLDFCTPRTLLLANSVPFLPLRFVESSKCPF